MLWPPEHAEMGQIEAALRRAAEAAREQARLHGVHVVVWKNGRVVWEPTVDTAPATPTSKP